MPQRVVRPVHAADRAWIEARTVEWWGAPIVVSRGRVFRPAELDGYVAEEDEKLAGLVTLHVSGGACEVVTLNSVQPGSRTGGPLLDAAEHYARERGCGRLWLITTNDNTPALRFYQRREFAIVTWHQGAIAASRLIKPQIPLFGRDGIPIRDEVELAKEL